MFRFGFKRRRVSITGPPSKVSGIVLTRGTYSVAASGATNQQLDVVVAWPRPAMAQRYDVYIGATAETIALVSDDQVARAYVPTQDIVLGLYYMTYHLTFTQITSGFFGSNRLFVTSNFCIQNV